MNRNMVDTMVVSRVNIDWQLLALMLRKSASLSEIERRLHITRGQLNRIARGDAGEPRFSDGIALLDYAYDVLGEVELRRCLVPEGRPVI